MECEASSVMFKVWSVKRTAYSVESGVESAEWSANCRM